ncbi:MAG: molybdopterin-dependent oxidoreductase, partial [Gammaproteobacteria bacterium]|nr:molybdopterin-dependent oxidoreductase [Gammaproteobacteria bacterium]
TDGALACAVMHVLFKEDFADRDYLARRTDFDADFENYLHSKTPQWAEEITGVPAATIVEFARLYGRSKRAYIRAGYGFARSRNGAVNMHAVTCLPAITGTWQNQGGGGLYGNNTIYPIDETLIKGLDCLQPSTRLLDQSRIGEVLCGNPADLQGGPPVTSLFIQNTNPVVVAPDTNRVIKGFNRDDLFTCVHEQFMTETAAMADVVLPATMFLEHNDIYKASGHTYIQATRKLIEPYEQCRSNHWVLGELAKRLGLAHRGFELSEWEMMDETLKASGLPGADELADKRWHDCALPSAQGRFQDGFSTPDGRFHFKPDWSRVGPHSAGMPDYPDHWEAIDSSSDSYPYRLVAAPARQFLNTSFTETPTARKMEKKPAVRLHPEDCEVLGVTDDDVVRLFNVRGEIKLPVEKFAGVQPGTVIVESIWPNADFAGGTGVNTLVSSDPGQPNGGAVFHDTAIAIERVTAD